MAKRIPEPTKGGVGCRPSLNGFVNAINVTDICSNKKNKSRQDQFELYVPASPNPNCCAIKTVGIDTFNSPSNGSVSKSESHFIMKNTIHPWFCVIIVTCLI